MSGRKRGMRTLVALGGTVFGAVLFATVAPAGGALAAAPTGGDVKSLSPATAEGALKTIAHYRVALERPPGLVADTEVAYCGRYLPMAVQRVHDDAAKEVPESAARCVARLDGLTALAMCQWHGGDTETARTTLGTLALQRCAGAGPGGEGLSRAVAISERWWDGKTLAPLLASMSEEARRPLAARLAEANRRRELALAALGNKPAPTRGALLVLDPPKGSLLARSGVRAGDLVELVDAAPAGQPGDLARRLAGKQKHSVLYWRGGKRMETVVTGASVAPVTVGLPEQLD